METIKRREPEINLHLGCSLAAMREMKDNQYDLAIVDPPYGIGADKKNNGKNSDRHLETSKAKINTYKKSNWDSKSPNKEYFEELFRVSKEQIIWGVNYFSHVGLKGGRIYWNKCVTMPTYSDGELAYCSKLTSIQSITYAWHGMIQGDMKNKEIRIHPTQKPIALYKWCLEKFAKDGDKILDTHLGSGSIACACYDLGFDLDAWEIDTDYYRDTLLRYNEYSKQIKLF